MKLGVRNLIKKMGIHIVHVRYINAETKIEAIACGAGTNFINNKCVIDVSSACGAGTTHDTNTNTCVSLIDPIHVHEHPILFHGSDGIAQLQHFCDNNNEHIVCKNYNTLEYEYHLTPSPAGWRLNSISPSVSIHPSPAGGGDTLGM